MANLCNIFYRDSSAHKSKVFGFYLKTLCVHSLIFCGSFVVPFFYAFQIPCLCIVIVIVVALCVFSAIKTELFYHLAIPVIVFLEIFYWLAMINSIITLLESEDDGIKIVIIVVVVAFALWRSISYLLLFCKVELGRRDL